jgi:predicted branched-subunit amino acid permease
MVDNFFCVWCYLRIWSIVGGLSILADFLLENTSLLAWINWVIATVLGAIYELAGTFSTLILEFSCINLALELA